MKNIIAGLYVLLCSPILLGQLPYTENNFDVHVETDIEYGQAEGFAGTNDTLLLDIYKPVGDNNCTRPCMVLIHGGAWIAGSKNDVNIVNIATDFAEKGWVVATINYRLGMHKTPSYEMYWACNDDISAPCGYIADSAEVYRAIYRGQQDAKGAIRFMKNRAEMDSVDIQNVFVAGESAGAFIAYAATFMTEGVEKPEFCEALANAPTPDPDLVSCLPDGYSLERPDLGPVHGTLNTGEHNATVEGVGGIYGGMLNFDILADETDWPVVYMYHQGSDVVVNYNYGRLLGRIDWECFSPTSLCQNYARYPKAYGSKGIETYFSTLGVSPERTVEIIENYEYMNDCFDNGHSIVGWMTRSQNMAELFAERVQENGNTPDEGPCNLGVNELNSINVNIYPNPGNGLINIENNQSTPLKINVYTQQGKLIQTVTCINRQEIVLKQGVYILRISTGDINQVMIKRIVVLK